MAREPRLIGTTEDILRRRLRDPLGRAGDIHYAIAVELRTWLLRINAGGRRNHPFDELMARFEQVHLAAGGVSEDDYHDLALEELDTGVYDLAASEWLPREQ